MSDSKSSAARSPGTAPLPPGRLADHRLLLALLRPYRFALVLALVLMLAQSVAALASPWIAGRFSSAILNHQAISALLLQWFALISVQSVLGYAAGVRLQVIALRLIADASTRVFDHLQFLPLGWHHDRRRGDTLSLLTQDVGRLGYFVTETLAPLLPLMLTCAGALFMMVRIEPRVGIAAAVFMPALYIGMRLIGRRLRPLGHEVAQAYATRNAVAEQNLSMLPIVKAHAGEALESDRFSVQSHALRDLEVAQARLHARVGPTVRVVSAAAVLALLGIAGGEVANGEMSAGGLVSLLLYGLLLTQPLSALAGVYGQMQSARGAMQRLDEVLRESPEPDEGRYEADAVQGAVVFDNVEFGYPGRDSVLRGLNLSVAVGETIAITGVNGAGKSTLAHLLLRFIEPQSGRILLDGRELNDFTLRNLRGHVGLVAQNVLLFNASVRDNIAYGVTNATPDKIEQAARAARAHDFVVHLPEGYDTIIGDQGIKISGGQRQRVALARALLHNSTVLILDEASAMLDPAGEREFIEECHEALRRRTVIVITHRPASLALADRVFRLEQGRLSEVCAPG